MSIARRAVSGLAVLFGVGLCALAARYAQCADPSARVTFPMTPEQAKVVQAYQAIQADVSTTETNSLGMTMVYIPPGRFEMGSPDDEAGRDGDEGPKAGVKLTRGFLLSAHEVTNAQYRAFRPEHDSGAYKDASLNGDDQPAVRVSWTDAIAFCTWLSRKEGRLYRLPTETEWEYACRAGSPVAFPNAEQKPKPTDHAWCKENADARSQSVGRKAPNAWGLYDMHGNVWEWCRDWYDAKAYRAGRRTDPSGPPTGAKRVVRGGSFRSPASGCRSANRYERDPTDRASNTGLRVACDVLVQDPDEGATAKPAAAPDERNADERHVFEVFKRLRFWNVRNKGHVAIGGDKGDSVLDMVKRDLHRLAGRRWFGRTYSANVIQRVYRLDRTGGSPYVCRAELVVKLTIHRKGRAGPVKEEHTYAFDMHARTRLLQPVNDNAKVVWRRYGLPDEVRPVRARDR